MCRLLIRGLRNIVWYLVLLIVWVLMYMNVSVFRKRYIWMSEFGVGNVMLSIVVVIEL